MTTAAHSASSAVPARPTSIAAYRARHRASGSTNRAGSTSRAASTSGATSTDRATTTGETAATRPTPSIRGLRAFYTAAARRDPHAADFHRVVAAVLARADRVDEQFAHEWNRMLGLLDRHRTNPKAAVSCGVLANLVGLAAFGDDADIAALDELTDRLGGDRVAAVQHRTARFVESDQTFPLTTAAVRRLVCADRIDHAVALLHKGIDPDEFLPVITTCAQLLGAIDSGSVREWRHHLSMIVASPWSPYARHLIDLAGSIDRPQVAAVVERFTETCREDFKEHEREQVAEEVRRLIAASGITQRDFAKWVGTSPSRLSSYVSGTVTPSASLMLRMARTSRLLQERDVPQAPLTLSEQSWGAARPAVDGGGTGRAAVPAERVSESLGRGRSHLSAV